MLKPSPRSIAFSSSTPSPIEPNHSNLLLKTLITGPAPRSMEILHLAQQRFQKPICRAFDSFAPALSPRWAPVYVARVPAAPFCKTPIDVSQAGVRRGERPTIGRKGIVKPVVAEIGRRDLVR